MSKYISKGSILHFDECEEIVSDCGTPPSCRQGVPVLPTRLSLSKHRAVSGDIINPYKISLPNYKIGQRLLRSGHIYVYDEMQTVFHHYDVSDTGLLVYSPWTRETDDGLIPIGTPEGNYLPYMTLPEKSVCYIAYSPGVWNWEMLKRFQEDFEELREKIGIKVDVKSWIGSLEGAMTFPIDKNYKEFIDDLNGADLSFSEWTKEANDQCGTDIPFPVDDVHKQMMNQAMKLEKPNPKCCMGIALYDPAGLMNDLAHLSGVLLHRIVEVNNPHAVWSAVAIESLYRQNLSSSQKEKLRKVEEDNKGLEVLVYQHKTRGYTEGLTESKELDELRNKLKNKNKKKFIREYIIKHGGGDIVKNVHEKERQTYLNMFKNLEEKNTEIIRERASLLELNKKGSLYALSIFYEVTSPETIQDLRAILARAVLGLSSTEEGAVYIATEYKKKENILTKALLGLTTPAPTGFIGMAIAAVDELVIQKALEKVPASQASASLWSEVNAAIKKAKIEAAEMTYNKKWFNITAVVARPIPQLDIEMLKKSEDLRKLNVTYPKSGAPLDPEMLKKSSSLRKFDKEIYSKPYTITRAIQHIDNREFLKALKTNLPSAGAHWIAINGVLAPLLLGLYAYNLNLAMEQLDTKGRDQLVNYLNLFGNAAGTGSVATVTAIHMLEVFKSKNVSAIATRMAVLANLLGTVSAASFAYMEDIKMKKASNKKQAAMHNYARTSFGVAFASGVLLIMFSFPSPVTLALVAIALLGMTLGAIFGAKANKYDPKTKEGWAYHSFWGKIPYEKRFKTLEEERKAFFYLLYTPKIKLIKGGCDNQGCWTHIKIQVPFLGEGTLLILNGKRLTITPEKESIGGSVIYRDLISRNSLLIYAPIGEENSKMIISKKITYDYVKYGRYHVNFTNFGYKD